MKILHFDCIGGASGDMIVAGLLSAGLPFEFLQNELKKIPLPPFEMVMEQKLVHGINAVSLRVIPQEKHTVHRHLHDILSIIEQSTCTLYVKDKAREVFSLLAHAESKIHGISVDEIHFHEVGALDSLVDIFSAVIGIEFFKPDRVTIGKIPLGSGITQSAHGALPLPAPATIEILKKFQITLTETPYERVTPTGAALIAGFVHQQVCAQSFTVESIGYGAGSRVVADYPNVLRLLIGQQRQHYGREDSVMIETNIDDMSPQRYTVVMDALFKKGALDVCLQPVYMKKNRPGIILSVLSRPMNVHNLIECIFEETTTLGVRFYPAERFVLARREEIFNSSLGPIRVKVRCYDREDSDAEFEFEDVKQAAEQHTISFRSAYKKIKEEYILYINNKYI